MKRKREVSTPPKEKKSTTVKKQRQKDVPDESGTAPLFHMESIGEGLEIKQVATSKDKIEQPDLAKHERKIIPPLGSSIIISGKSGSGKSTLLQNLLTDPRFYGKSPRKPNGWFSKTFLFAPTGGSDDILKSLNIPENHVFTDISDAPSFLDVIQKSQAGKLKGGNKAHTVDQFCVIFEDIIGETTFMNSSQFRKMFYMVRHLNCTTFICTQHFNRVPRVCRLQASFIYFFAGGLAEVEIIADMFAPPMYNKKEFMHMVNEATKMEFSFLTICMKVGWKDRFRRNLDEFITLPRLVDPSEENKKTKKCDRKEEDKKSSKEEEDFSAKKMQDALGKAILIKRDRDVRANEQTESLRHQWAYKGPRGRVVW